MASPEHAAALAALTAGPLDRAAAARLFPKPGPDITWTAVDAGGVPAEWVSAGCPCDRSRAFLYLHGGGYTEGSPSSHRELVSRIARHARVPALSIDYRLAPAHPYPAALDDAVAAWSWLADRVPADRIALVGDSAGGGLALGLAIWLRDQGRPSPALVAALSPWGDLELSEAEGADDPLIAVDELRERGRWYLGGADPRTAYASPVHGRLEGLPPIYIQVGDREALLGDSRRIAANARAAGVRVDLDVWPGMTHVWHVLGDGVPEAREATLRLAEAIAGALPPAAAA